ncbi:MAG: hypothetical protein ACN6OP_25875 [Pseudomonadales bacterium]
MDTAINTQPATSATGHQQIFRLEAFASGRYDVYSAINGLRAGSLIGGNGQWCAEQGNKPLGYFGTKDDAAMALIQARGFPFQTLFEQMRAFIEGPQKPLQHYQDDFYKHDRAYLEEWQNATDMLWFVTDTATHLVMLDLDEITKREGNAILEARDPTITGKPLHLHHLDVATGRMRPCTPAKALALINNQAQTYRLASGAIKKNGETLARLTLTVERLAAQSPLANIAMAVTREPSQKEIAVLRRFAAYAAVRHFGSLFAAVGQVRIADNERAYYDSATAVQKS